MPVAVARDLTPCDDARHGEAAGVGVGAGVGRMRERRRTVRLLPHLHVGLRVRRQLHLLHQHVQVCARMRMQRRGAEVN